MADLASLEQRIGFRFENHALLEQALTHPSRAQESTETPDNQRLEYLGDAVLGLVLAEALFRAFPEEREGHLAQSRSVLAKGAFLAELARKLDLPDSLFVSESERNQDGHQRDAALEDALEALIGAIFLDSDYTTTRDCILSWYGDIPATLRRSLAEDNPKGRLQELTQAQGAPPPAYQIVHESGPGHARQFAAEVIVHGAPMGTGAGTSKKEAEEAAARDALAKLPPPPA